MPLWLVRAGSHGEHEKMFFETGSIYLTWEGLEETTLSAVKDWDGIKAVLRSHYSGKSERVLGNWASQVWAFVLEMKKGDWIVVPRKSMPALAFGEVTGEYVYDEKGPHAYRHVRRIKWMNTEVPRSVMDQDLLYSFGSLLTICKPRANDAEARVRRLAANNWRAQGGPAPVAPSHPVPEEVDAEAGQDLEQIARDQIAKAIIAKFKGHGLARLVEAVLKAQGYTTHLSPEGPDKGVDILAGPGALGFGKPRICVQVKSGDSPLESSTLNELIGSMQNVHAEQGLLVSWGGFKSSILKEVPVQFFRVRVWNQGDLITQVFENYEKLDEGIRAELPLKRIWTMATENSQQ